MDGLQSRRLRETECRLDTDRSHRGCPAITDSGLTPNRKGEIVGRAQELAMPVQTGPFKFVPFISGEAARYGEDVNGNPLTRLLGQAGVRASVPMSHSRSHNSK